MANPIRSHHKRPKGPSWNKVVPHHILLNKGKRTCVGDVVGCMGRRMIKMIKIFKCNKSTLQSKEFGHEMIYQ